LPLDLVSSHSLGTSRDEPDGRIELACAGFASQLRNRGVTPVFWGSAQPGILRQPLPDPLLKGEGTRGSRFHSERGAKMQPLPNPLRHGEGKGSAYLSPCPALTGEGLLAAARPWLDDLSSKGGPVKRVVLLTAALRELFRGSMRRLWALGKNRCARRFLLQS